eukprot:scaffold843_cov327-Prasinococcus_capsulatus_cf.AAC.9
MLWRPDPARCWHKHAVPSQRRRRRRGSSRAHHAAARDAPAARGGVLPGHVLVVLPRALLAGTVELVQQHDAALADGRQRQQRQACRAVTAALALVGARVYLEQNKQQLPYTECERHRKGASSLCRRTYSTTVATPSK